MNFCDKNPCKIEKDCTPKINFGTIKCTFSEKFATPLPCDCEDEQLIIKRGICAVEQLNILLADGQRRWTEIVVPEILCIPPQKPDIEQIISIFSKVEILSQKVIKTPKGAAPLDPTVENQEGTLLTGKKLIVEGVLLQKVIYTADVPAQSVHSAHFDVPFSAFIVLDPNDPLIRKFFIDVCIEDIYISRITNRQIFKNITLFIKATPLVCP